MEISREKCTITLIAASIFVLLIEYKWIIVGEFSLGLGIFSFSEIKTNVIFWPAISIAIIAGSLVCHISKSFPELSIVFSFGYQENPHFVNLVKNLVAEACGSYRYDSPRGGLKHSFVRRKHNIGKFIIANNELSNDVIIYPPTETHIRCVLSGLRSCLAPKLWAIYIPVIFGIWALDIILIG